MSIWFLYNTLGPQSCSITPHGRTCHKPFENKALRRLNCLTRGVIWFYITRLVFPSQLVHRALDALASPVQNAIYRVVLTSVSVRSPFENDCHELQPPIELLLTPPLLLVPTSRLARRLRLLATAPNAALYYFTSRHHNSSSHA